jgi:hypothetical protein
MPTPTEPPRPPAAAALPAMLSTLARVTSMLEDLDQQIGAGVVTARTAVHLRRIADMIDATLATTAAPTPLTPTRPPA